MYARYIPYITLSITMLYIATICVAVRKCEVVSAVELLVGGSYFIRSKVLSEKQTSMYYMPTCVNIHIGHTTTGSQNELKFFIMNSEREAG